MALLQILIFAIEINVVETWLYYCSLSLSLSLFLFHILTSSSVRSGAQIARPRLFIRVDSFDKVKKKMYVPQWNSKPLLRFPLPQKAEICRG